MTRNFARYTAIGAVLIFIYNPIISSKRGAAMKRRTYPSAVLLFLMILTSPALADETPSEFEILGAFEKAIAKIVDQSMPAVVSITVVRTKDDVHNEMHPSGAASGFIFHKDGYILTNEHVIENAKSVIVALSDHSTFEADIIGGDKITDVAVLKIERPAPFPFLQIADSAQVRIGQFTIAIGHPMGYRNTVTSGIVSGIDRCFHPPNNLYQYCYTYIQTNAWINPGSSGGPLLNMQGEVIGITTLNPGEGATLAIESSLAKTIAQQLITHGRVIRGYLDAQLQDVGQGIEVMQVAPNIAAAQKGLKLHDIIVEFEGKRVPRRVELEMRLMGSVIGKQYALKVLRGTQETTIHVRAIEMPVELRGCKVNTESISWKTLGLAVRTLEQNNHQKYAYLTEHDRGVLVEKVKETSPGAKAGIPRGALIVDVNGQKITGVQSFDTFLQKHQDDTKLILSIKGVQGIQRITIKSIKEKK